MITVSLLGIVISVVTYLLLLDVYHKYNKKDIKITAIGFLLYGLITISYMILAFGTSDTIASIATNVHRFLAIIAFGIGFNLTLVGFQGLIEAPIPFRYYVWMFLDTVVVPFALATGLEFSWNGSRWIAEYSPEFFRYVVVAPAFFIGIEIGLSTFRLIKDTPITKIKIYYGVMTVSFLATVPLFILRHYYDMPFNLFILPIVFYFIILALTITSQPEIFLTTSIDPYFLLIIEAETGIPVKTYHFVQNDYVNSNEALMAGAISAIQSVLRESSQSDQELNYIGLNNLHIESQRYASLQFLLASRKKSDALKLLLVSLSEKMSTLSPKMGFGALREEEVQELNNIVKEVFLHQLNRLDLILKSLNIQS